ncbi:MAG TPA: flagellar hook-basal body complex protein [Gallionella sp.]|nr:flagellar hook-basal body complex protein [Gallionella sp.]
MGFQQGLSGLNASAKQLDTIGNNVANANTVGFKQSQAQFADLYASSLAGSGAMQVGTGVQVVAISQQFTQGNISNTSNPMDTAISGQGFFRMLDQNGAIVYSRNGQFQLDKNGFIVNNQGHQVTGFAAVNGVITGAQPTPIQVSSADLTPKQTSNLAAGGVPIGAGLTLDSRVLFATGLTQGKVVGSAAAGLTITAGVNDAMSVTVDGVASGAVTIPPGTYATATALASAVQTAVNAAPALVAAGKTVVVTADATGALTLASGSAGATSSVTAPTGTASATLFGAAPVVTAGAGVFNPLDSATYNNSTSLTVYDSLGSSHIASLYFQKTASNTWNTYLTVDGAQLPASGTALTTLTFNSNGKLTGPAATPPLTLGQVTSAQFTPMAGTVPNGASPQTLTFDFSTSQQYGGNSVMNSTTGNFGVNSMTQDGYTSGRLSSFSTSADGTILGRYTNGQTRSLGQVVLANFTSPQGLQPLGNNTWAETAASGGPLVGVPGSSSLGVLKSSATEDSNVDLTAELVNMITAQRVYQANAQTIKTQDAVLQTIVNLR